MAWMLTAYRRSLIASTTALALGFVHPPPSHAFNPNEGAQPISAARQLPDTTVLSVPTPIYRATAPTAMGGGYVPPTAPLAMPARPTPLAAPPPLPPVDPAVAARAKAIMASEGVPTIVYAPPPPAGSGFVVPSAPTPLAPPYTPMASPTPTSVASPRSVMPSPPPAYAAGVTPRTVSARPITYTPAETPVGTATGAPRAVMPPPPPANSRTPAPLIPAPVVAGSDAPLVTPVASSQLSDETRTILSHVPSALDKPKLAAGSAAIKLDRADPEIQSILGSAKPDEESFESVGLSITVRRPGLDTNYELNRAYNALMGGDADAAIQTYKNILGSEPSNEEALFGLAATYHRLGNVEQARPLYGRLLQVNPNNREGLNNFLVLVSDESPEDALPELERLEARNPDFSPIPAQIAIVYDKLGYADASKEKMMRAIELAPDNMSYKYNLAVMLDRRGDYGNAAALYRALIKASLAGAIVPSSTEAMQKRLNYIVTEMNSARTAVR